MEIPIIAGTHNFDHFMQMFKHYFTNPQYRNLTHYMLGLLLCEGKRTVTRMSTAHSIDVSYNRLHHFISDSPWKHAAVNEERIDIFMNMAAQTAKQKNKPSVGFLIADDTTNPKRGRKMPGYGLNHSTITDTQIPSQCIVTTLYHYEGIDVPLYASLYKSDAYCKEHDEQFKTKNELFAEQLKRITLPTGIRTIALFDSWYFNYINCAQARAKGLDSIGCLRSNRRALISSTDAIGTRLDNWFDYLRRQQKHPFQRITIPDSHGKKQQFWMFCWRGTIKNFGAVTLIMLSSKLKGRNIKPVFIATTAPDLSAMEIIEYYFKRWAIETFFWTVKERLGFNHYQVRTEQATTRHWLLVFLAYSYLVYSRRTCVSDYTLGDIRRFEQHANFKALIAHIYENIKKRRKKVDAIYYDLAA